MKDQFEFAPFVSVINDLSSELEVSVRYQRLLAAIKTAIPCDAIALLKLESDKLVPLAFEGLSDETRGRRFDPDQHPRLFNILNARSTVRFASDSDLPDPYDGLVHTNDGQLHVHDCMGTSIYIDDKPWGVITFDALKAGQFSNVDPEIQQTALALTRAVIKAAQRIERLEQKIEHGNELTAELIREQGPSEIIGSSSVMKALLAEIDTVAESNLSVLVYGETGVGKELIARRLHLRSLRNKAPLVQINCAALPDNIIESELFGHTKGAFTGATDTRKGRFELADGGTLFLDEVGELPLNAQAKLLRVLQNGEIQRVGSDQLIKVDVRVIAATNRDLKEEVQAGRFRADLYHRLSVYPVTVPPLRERDRDVIELAGYFLEKNQYQLGVNKLRLTVEAKAALLNYQWPGNVRELEHLLSRAAIKAIADFGRVEIVALSEKYLELEPVNSVRASFANEPGQAPQGTVLPSAPLQPLRTSVDEYQKQLIETGLQRNKGNVAATARDLQVDRSNLLRLIRRLGIPSP